MPQDSLVSVVIPVWNGARFLRDAVASVLAQEHELLEILVIDDGSTDQTEEVAQTLGRSVTYVKQENQGPAAARNRGLRLASGQIIGLLDVDDLWEVHKLSVQLPVLQKKPDIDVVWGRTQVMTCCGPMTDILVFSESGEPRFFPQLGSFLFRRCVFDSLGTFETAQRHADDIDFLARAQEAGLSIFQHEDVVLRWRRHSENITNDVALDRKYFVAAIKRSLERRRAGR